MMMSRKACYRDLLATLVDCSERVREAVLRAEIHRLADVVGMGADGAATSHIDDVAERAALSFLDDAEPRMNILSEEVGFIDRGAALTAIVDPIDATNNAISLPNFHYPDREDVADLASHPGRAGHIFGYPFFAFSVGVLADDGLVAGCVRNLPTGEVFTAARGCGVELDGIPVRGSGRTTLDGARIGLIRPETGTAYEALREIIVGHRVRVRMGGCSALDLALIACGTLDGLLNPNLLSPGGHGEKIVDYAGGLALLNEMGGVLTHHDGSPIPVNLDLSARTPLLAATTPEFHERVREILAEVVWGEIEQ